MFCQLCVSVFLILLTKNCVRSHDYESPCPDLFYYEPPGPNPETQWSGVITLLNEAELNGVYVRLIFDRRSKQLGNWFGEVDTRDNIQYLIRNRNFTLQANIRYQIRFYITYDNTDPPPKLLAFRLNARTVCSSFKTTTTTTTTVAPTTTATTTTEKPADPAETSEETASRLKEESTTTTTTDFPLTGFQTSRPLFNQLNAPVCGTVPQKLIPLVLGGYETFEGEFPWHVAIYKTENRLYLMLTCGGNLITRTHVLTAAHCVTRKYAKQLIDLSQIQIFLGTSNLIRFNPGVQVRAASNAMVHPDYNPVLFHNDIAIIELSGPVEITDFVRTICLWQEDPSIEKMYGKIGSVVGWRHDKFELIPDKLLGANMPIISKEKCIFSNRNFFSRVIFENNYCAGFLNGTSVCSGDSGGGMVFKKEGQSEDNVIWQLRGLVSASSALKGQCNPNNYIVFTDVAQYLDWIRTIALATKIKQDY